MTALPDRPLGLDLVVKPYTGFDTHPHRDMEIVTSVLDGELEHRDTLGDRVTLHGLKPVASWMAINN